MSDNHENPVESEDEYNPKAHKQLLQSVNQLGKTQFIKKPSRSEPALAHDEFHLVKSGKDSVARVTDTSVSVGDLVKVLNKTKKHLDIGKELRNTHANKKVLPKPLERPVAEKIQRTIGYEKTVKNLRRWDAVVAQNRSADNQTFPLEYEEIHADLSIDQKIPSKHCIKSELMIEMAAIEEKLRQFNAPANKDSEEIDETEKKLQQKQTRAELAVRRKELAYLRIRESQKSAKARLQNKIKSKKFHKLLKREKLKEQMQEFEILQKVNPEAALEKLEMIEKSRILERANLRHKNTGTWAKNLQVRAKYDKDVRNDLSEQLAISRELTQKKNVEESSDDEAADNEDDLQDKESVDPFNPWVKVGKNNSQSNSNEINSLVDGYRKYWTERNQNTTKLENYRKSLTEDNEIVQAESSNTENDNLNLIESNNIEITDKKKSKKQQSIQKTKINDPIKAKTVKQKEAYIEHGWLVEDLKPIIVSHKTTNKKTPKNIDDLFDEAENYVEHKVTQKLKSITKQLVVSKNNDLKMKPSNRKRRDELKNLKDLSFKSQKTLADLDEELLEISGNAAKQNANISSENQPIIKDESQTTKTNKRHNDIIDPNQFADIKPRRLRTSLPNADTDEYFAEDANDTDIDTMKQMTIAEAFEDDDIIADFQKEKSDQTKDANETIDLSMPGWGSWGGCGIDPTKKNKRLVLKFPKEENRRDENKGNVYINENVNKQLKEHLVSDLPFPFTCVQDYEASIRGPIGRNFVPETAFKVLTRPGVVTKMGKIINPMTEKVLVQKPKMPRNTVDVRIAEMIKSK